MFLAAALLCASVGCGGAKPTAREKYESLWRLSTEANPTVVRIRDNEPGNLTQSTDFQTGRVLTTSDAITNDLETQMREFGLKPDLNGLIAIFTTRLKDPQATSNKELARSTWMLGTRNMFWTTLPNKKVEVHYTGELPKVLVLRLEGEPHAPCYMEANHSVAEYLYQWKH
jgi:hypothetical protein